MPDTPLNPDALEAVARERYESRRSFEDLPPWEDLLERNRKAEIRALGNRVSAYLAAAQPVVNSVEELDALPAGSIIFYDEGFTIIAAKKSYYDGEWYVTGCNEYRRTDTLFPATVMHRPEVDE